jgi:cytochrome-b5 reductase
MHHFLTRYLSFQRFAITPSFASVTLAGILPTTNDANRTMCKESIPKVDDAAVHALPSSMTGPPVAALVPPGKCQFGTEWTTVPLLARFPVSSTSSVLRFGLPNAELPLQLSTCACILANATIDGEDVVRPYTPISTNADIGTFDLLVKNYGPTAKMSRHMHEIEPVHENGSDNGSAADATDSSIRFKHIEFNVKIQAPFDQYDHVYMLVGGTGM